MKEALAELLDRQDRQRQSLADILKILQEERRALKENDPASIPGLLVGLQEASTDAMKAEAERRRAALDLASAMKCSPSVREFCSRLAEEDRRRLRKSAGDLLEVVLAIKECGFILNRQATEHRLLAELLLERLKNAGSPFALEGAGLDTHA
ncbi:MAG: hypothetical protein ACC613_04195 [Synergistales bacterium]